MPKQKFENPKGHRWLRRLGWTTTPKDRYDSEVEFTDEHERNAITSLSAVEAFDPFSGQALHYPVIDIDGPVRIVPSSTAGHFHLFLDKAVEEDAYFDFLRAAARIGLVEEGYVAASIRRGHTTVFRQTY